MDAHSHSHVDTMIKCLALRFVTVFCCSYYKNNHKKP